MKYPHPDFRIAGDCHILIYFGDSLDIELNFMAQGLAKRIADSRLPGVIDTVTHFASLMIQYDPDVIELAALMDAVKPMAEASQTVEEIILDSRLISIPVLFFDPWTRECIEDYCSKIRQKEFDVDLLLRLNNLNRPEELRAIYSATEHWVATVGFRPGLPMCLPLDPRCRILAPKYDPPRTWTPVGSLGIGGAALGFYATASAGGYQLFGRTPWPIWDRDRRYPPFHANACLFRPADRLRIVPVDLDEYKEIEQRIADGGYVFNIVEYQKFSVGDYRRWVSAIDQDRRFVTA